METLFAVISFPFWFFGIVFTLAGFFGTITINGRKTSDPKDRFYVIILGVIFLFIAYAMV